MKDNEIAALVNQTRDIAVQFGSTQQLRERLASVLVPALLADRAARAVEVPEGWLLVPIEPTLEMIDAWNHRFGSGTVTAQTDWTNMISAAPTQELTPAPNQGDPS